MANVRVVLKLRGLNQLMRSEPVQRVVNERAKRIAAAAGEDFEAVPKPHKWTARAYVQAKNARGMRAEARDKVLTRAVGNGRG